MLERLLNQKTLLNTILIGVLLGGFFAYMQIGKLEDAEIAIKSAVVITIYPGATPHEVELEVTDVLEKALQKLENIDDIESRSLPGMSQITVNIDSKVHSKEIPQIWDHLRRKVHDASILLPQGAYPPMVNDDFGDVYGIFLTVTGEGYEFEEFTRYTDLLKRDLLDVDGVKRIEEFGAPKEIVDIRLSTEKLANLNINPYHIIQALNEQTRVVNPGSLVSGSERIRLSVGEKFKSVEEIENFLVQVPQGGSFRLGDITEVKRSFDKPVNEALFYNGKSALSLAVSMESGVNVIEVGENFQEKLAEIDPKIPAGIEIHSVFSQPERVQESINGFVINLVESVLIVILVLLLFMGLRSGVLIASGLVFTILGTFIAMLLFDMQLHRVSLSAIIVAMGMLVDNSIVIADGIIIDLKRGIPRSNAITSIVKKTALPLLGATLIAILAFMPLALSPSNVGEYLKSLFFVLAISLFLSWVFAMIQTPFVASRMFKKGFKKSKGGLDKNPFETPFYQRFKNLVRWSLYHKSLFVISSVVVLLISLYSFKFVKFEFMPMLDYNQFVIQYKMPKGTDIAVIERDLKEISNEILAWDEVYNVTAAIGRTPARYTLIRPVSQGGSNYGELIIDVEDFDATNTVGAKIVDFVHKNYPQAEVIKKQYGPIFTDYEIEVQFSGPDPAVLRTLAGQAKSIMRNDSTVGFVTDNWKNKVKIINPEYAVEQAQKLGITRNDLSNAIAIATSGMTVGVLHSGDKTIPIKLQLDQPIAQNINSISNIPVWGSYSRKSVPMAQVTEGTNLIWQDDEIYRYNGQRAIKAQCDPKDGYLSAEVEKRLIPLIEAIKLPTGYSMEWKGTSADSKEAQSSLFKFLPLALGLMLLIVIALFNNVKQSIIIFAIFPFAFIGIVFGFITTGALFGFVGIIGALGLIGMMIKNSIVLLDEISRNVRIGLSQVEAIINAVTSRMRPVVMASATTILGMIPLLFDKMFNAMAITIIFGLLFGTIITLFVVPVMYAFVFRVNTNSAKEVSNVNVKE